jgi:hypothetical protein
LFEILSRSTTKEKRTCSPIRIVELRGLEIAA